MFRFSIGSRDMGIDLGTANTLVYMKGKGIVLREPSVVARKQKNKEVIAVGSEAKEMIGRAPSEIEVIYPLRKGVISDYSLTAAMTKYFLNKANKKSIWSSKPLVMVCMPTGVTSVEQRAVLDAVKEAGAKDAFPIEEALAAAIGADLPVWEPVGSMVVDIGSGTTEVAVISLGGIATSNIIGRAGDEMDRSIINYVRKQYNLIIGDRTAERVKREIGFAGNEENEGTTTVPGRDLLTGLPKTIDISADEIAHALRDTVDIIVDVVKLTLEETPPELASDILERGIVLTGGGALLQNLDKVLSEKMGIPVFIAQNPLDCVALGVGKSLDQIHLFKAAFKLTH